MGKVYVTGDTHGIHDIDKLMRFDSMHPELTKEDLVIICGDFGVIWNKYYLEEQESLIKTYEDFNFSVAFVLGNHEGYNLLETYDIEIWNEGKVRRISPSIVQLMNGEVYLIEEQVFFVMGGAQSTDKEWRQEGRSWWPQEIPNDTERLNATMNLTDCDWDVNYVLTHTIPSSNIKKIGADYRLDEYTDWLDWIKDRLTYDHWYAGHFHIDYNFNDNVTLSIEQIHEII